VVLFGGSDALWGTTPLPLALDGLGATGCALRVAADVGFGVTATAAGAASFAFSVPRDNSLIGMPLFHQYISVDAGANAAGFTLSNGLRGAIGD
jgi:hypothetical protein